VAVEFRCDVPRAGYAAVGGPGSAEICADSDDGSHCHGNLERSKSCGAGCIASHRPKYLDPSRAYVVRQLQPWFENWASGVEVAQGYTCGFRFAACPAVDPDFPPAGASQAGGVWEGFVIEQILSWLETAMLLLGDAQRAALDLMVHAKEKRGY